MFVVVAITPQGGEIFVEIHETEDEARSEMERQVAHRGAIWEFALRAFN